MKVTKEIKEKQLSYIIQAAYLSGFVDCSEGRKIEALTQDVIHALINKASQK